MTDAAIAELAPQIGVRDACEAVGAAQASYYRRHRQSPPPQRPAPVPHRDRPPAAGAEPRPSGQAILEVLHSDRFVDIAPAEVWATLLDEGATSARSPRSTGCCARPARSGNGAGRPPTRPR